MLEKIIRNNAEIFITKEILEEFGEVLERDFLYAEDEVKILIELVLQFVILVNSDIKVDVVKEDSDDNKIIECAIGSKAKYILTYDKHLLKIREFREIKIITPEEFLDVV